MTKTELERKHLSDLHLLAAEAGVEKYRMLTRSELIDKLAEGNGGGAAKEERSSEPGAESEERPRRRRRRSRTGSPAVADSAKEGREDEREQQPRQPRTRPKKAPEREPAPEPAPRRERSQPTAKAEPTAAESPRPRRRRRRRFGRRKQGVTLQTLLLPPEAGRQALVFAETREGCTALLRNVAADLAADAKAPEPVALLIDPSPEALADWKREAPQ